LDRHLAPEDYPRPASLHSNVSGILSENQKVGIFEKLKTKKLMKIFPSCKPAHYRI
jgi:hypothetical protein